MEERQEPKTPYGGQAVIEGVMMRGQKYYAVACRRENQEIIVQQESVQSILSRLKWMNKPFLRGMLALFDALTLGIKSLMFSANVAMEDIEQNDPKKKAEAEAETEAKADSSEPKKKKKSQSINDIAIGATVVFALALGVGLFFVTPQLIVGQTKRWIGDPIALNVLAGVVKLSMFIAYVAVISRMKDIQRVFQYHGAEHKVINTLEANQELCAGNFSKHGTIHPRCGTSFVLVVMFISIVVFCFLGWSESAIERIVSRLILLPIIAGIAYEVIRLAGRHRESKLMKCLLSPGLMMQRLTTRPPSDDQVEVAYRALKAVMEKEEEEAKSEISLESK